MGFWGRSFRLCTSTVLYRLATLLFLHGYSFADEARHSHDKLELSMVNRWGLLYTLQGSSKGLQPILFAAHQDVVPATSPDKWAHPPFKAHFDGQYVWGRGASDCKNNLIGVLSVVESLLSQNWKPKRTILLAFGFDEEVGGEKGAKNIAIELEKRYGKHGVAMIVDEGGMGVNAVGDYVYALPAVAEKGFLDVHLTLEVNGGHSSRPPAHSGIGIMAEMIVALEANPFQPRLTTENPFRGFLECQVRYSPREIESWLQDALINGEDELYIGTRLADARGEEVRFSMQTSQAVDVINAGQATNQLPESVKTIVNYRIAPHDSIDSVKQGVAELVSPIAKKYGIAVRGFGKDDEVKEGDQMLILSSTDDLSPSPITPTGSESAVWNVFGGTVRQVFEDTESFKGKTVVLVGDIMTGRCALLIIFGLSWLLCLPDCVLFVAACSWLLGVANVKETGNTDTIHYWNVSRNIYRFSPAREGTRQGIHTIDEHMDINAHVEGMRVYYDLMRNFDGVDV